MSTPRTDPHAIPAIVGEPEVVEDVRTDSRWLLLKASVSELQALQLPDGSLADPQSRTRARALIETIASRVISLIPVFPHDATYLTALAADFRRWGAAGVGVPDFYDSLVAFQPQTKRVDGIRHLVVFPMYTQNGSRSRLVEAVLIEVIWPDYVAELEAGDYSNALFVPIRFLDFTSGYDTNSAVLFPETVAMRETPPFTWGAIYADREAARFRRVVREAATITRLDLPGEAQHLLADQAVAEETFVLWDLIHDRTHMRGDLPFDPFMIKQRMPFFLYTLEELRCDLTAYRECVGLERRLAARSPESLTATEAQTLDRARQVQYAIIFDRIFRFALTGSRSRNYDGLGGQLLFAWLHQHHVLHWTDTRLTLDWAEVPGVVMALGDAINSLYWHSIDRPKVAHWLAAYALVSTTVTPHPASIWAQGPEALPLTGAPRELTDLVLDDEFPLSMFYEALQKKLGGVIESTSGITGEEAGDTATREVSPVPHPGIPTNQPGGR
ncbi:hypothetical protein GCM10022198_10710 [Klugiella xanthotipulae]|uniref:Uncharacterized protein n=1 Tax=Klugiella xanthotipulae TaxID=244735 RepID=A0A543HYS6_9MICO|nr:DUF6421 family protein [Klugiella xanthotipulae]TQM63468.1 hypothetical protein FB466_1731 [Klugiella xanthotipulae]